MIPVVFIHFGPCEYADAVVAQALRRGNEVVFLNPTRAQLLDHPFANSYEHMSGNHSQFELACMVRWFYLRDWMQAQGVPDCLYCDTDVLLYANAEHEWHSDPYYYDHDFTLSLGTSGHTSFWKFYALDQLVHFIEDAYRNRDETFKECARIYHDMLAQHLPGGVSDMLLLKLFAAQSALRVGEMSVVRNGTVWDHNLNAADGFTTFNGRKTILFRNGDPSSVLVETVERVRFHSLHMQGGAKQWILNYLSESPF